MLGREKFRATKTQRQVSVLAILLVFLFVSGNFFASWYAAYIGAAEGGAVRGEANDLWADIVLGKRDFGEIAPRKIVLDKVSSPGGVIVDRSESPGRAYVWDSGNSRIIGIDLEDCYLKDEEERCAADIVIGQPSATDWGACNRDSSFQYYPERAPAGAETICGIPEWTHTSLEHKTFTSMFVDDDGNLYVGDFENHRVLKYINPFTTDSIADEVWGQVNFTGNKCNLTRGYNQSTPAPTASSICFYSTFDGGAGVALDADGNLWVADGGNNRVLRFPNNDGVIAKTADIVIGQANFTSAASGSSSTNLKSPTTVRFGSTGDLFIADAGNNRVMRYTAPFTSGMSGTAILDDSDFPGGLVAIEMDPSENIFWTYENEGAGAGFRDWDLDGVSEGHHFTNWNPGGGSIGIDTEGNILVSAYVYQQDVARFSFDDGEGDYLPDMSLFSPPGGYNLTSPDRFEQGGWGGVAVVDDQLIATDGRLMFWNDLSSITNGKVADGFVTYEDGALPLDGQPGYNVLKADKSGHIYVVRSSIYERHIDIFETPLTEESEPLVTLTGPFNAAGGGTVNVADTFGGLAPSPDGQYLWVANTDYHRVFRIRNPLTDPVVDIMLGQTSLGGTQCNRGVVPPPNVDGSQSADRSMLCLPGALSLDNNGNLFVSDHFFEIDGNWRLLMFAASSFPASPESVVFGLSAAKEFPRVNPITGFAPSTFETAFDSENRMVTGYNPYSGPRFIEYFEDPTEFNPSNRSDPAYAVADGQLEDFYGWPFAMTFDEGDNLYVYDTNRGKIMIYEHPFGEEDDDDDDPGNGNGNGNGNGGGNGGPGGGGGGTQNTTTNQTTTNTTIKNTSVTNKPNGSSVFINDTTEIQELVPAIVDSGSSIIQSFLRSVLGSVVFIQSQGPLILIFLALLLLALGTLLILLLLNPVKAISAIIGYFKSLDNEYWGIVLNEQTGAPVSLAIVTLLRKETIDNDKVKTSVVARTLTDLGGKYRLDSEQKENMFIEVQAAGYDKYLRFLDRNEAVSKFDNQIYDVYLTPKKVLTLPKTQIFNLFNLVVLVASAIGFLNTIYNQVANSSLQNVLLLIIYSLIFITVAYPKLYQFFLKKNKVLDESTNSGIAGAVLRAYDEDAQLVDIAATNKKGEVSLDLDHGNYYVVVDKKGYNMKYGTKDENMLKIVPVEIKKNGYINKNIVLSKLAPL